MKKINWFRRLFFSWSELEAYFNSGNVGNESDIKSKDKIIKVFEDRQEQNEIKIKKLEHKVEEFKFSEKTKQQEKIVSQKVLSDKKEEIIRLEESLKSIKESREILLREVSEKLKPLDKIDNTFFGTSGNKGKGMLGEMQLETILNKSGLPNDFWTKNLMVGKNQVEFAIRSGQEILGDNRDKWIPIDSKVLDVEKNEDNEIFVDEKYRGRVLAEVKKVTKYLGKNNTTDYGILVLQSDSIYMKLYEQFPSFFNEMIQTHKVYISSPSSFVNFSWSISHILGIYKKIHNEEKVYDDAISLAKSITSFGSSIYEGYDKIRVAMDKHYPLIQKKQIKLSESLGENAKVKPLKTIEIKDKQAAKKD